MATTKKSSGPARSTKIADLERNRVKDDGTVLTTDQGLAIPNTDNSLKAGVRGPSLIDDFHLREKITRFDHERIPERVVHARGSAAHGVFKLYEPLGELTTAEFLNDPKLETPVFVRFSTVQGSRGSNDTVRDVRGFAVKFYTNEGNFDLVGNNMPVFFIQDGIKFPDFVHAVKPEPHNEMPQGGSAHDTFYDFCSLQPESAHMVMWAMSDRGLPRSYAQMEGFGVHTFRLIDSKGKSRFIKWHWKPVAGVHSFLWDEAQKIQGKDADFHRRDLWESIAKGNYPEFELAIQIIDEKIAAKVNADILDCTKLIPEELAPIRKIGKMTLNRNPDNYFAEAEQVAFCVANVVPGIGFTNDPLMQARLFSYLDTQLTRLGGPNHQQIPINRPIAPVHNHQQDGLHQHHIPSTQANYYPNSIAGGCPFAAKGAGATAGAPALPSPSGAPAGYVHFPQAVEGLYTRERSPSFGDHFTQAQIFFHSMSPPEKDHITDAYSFELSKVERKDIRDRYVNAILANIDTELAKTVADRVGVKLTAKTKTAKPKITSPALSMAPYNVTDPKGMMVAILAAPGANGAEITALVAALTKAGVVAEVVGPFLGPVANGAPDATKTLFNTASVLWDAVYVAGGQGSIDELEKRGDAAPFLKEAFRHAKPIGGGAEGADFVEATIADDAGGDSWPGVVRAKTPKDFLKVLGQRRYFERNDLVPPRA